MNVNTERAIELIRYNEPVSYEEGYAAQVARRKAVEAGEAGPALFVLEHCPVVTLGRDTDLAHLLRTRAQYEAMGIDVVEVDRGGDVTYHGPGHLTAYPVLDLRSWKQSVRWYLRALEDVIIRVLAVYGIAANRLEGYTGVWVDEAKVAQVGIGLRDWVTYHGVALNVDPDMSHFGLIVPCGIGNRPVTSMAELLGKAPEWQYVSQTFIDEFVRYFGAWPAASDAPSPPAEAPD